MILSLEGPESRVIKWHKQTQIFKKSVEFVNQNHLKMKVTKNYTITYGTAGMGPAIMAVRKQRNLRVNLLNKICQPDVSFLPQNLDEL